MFWNRTRKNRAAESVFNRQPASIAADDSSAENAAARIRFFAAYDDISWRVTLRSFSAIEAADKAKLKALKAIFLIYPRGRHTVLSPQTYFRVGYEAEVQRAHDRWDDDMYEARENRDDALRQLRVVADDFAAIRCPALAVENAIEQLNLIYSSPRHFSRS